MTYLKLKTESDYVQQVLETCQELVKRTQFINETCIEQVLKPNSNKKQKLLRVFNEIQKQIIVIQNLVLSIKSKCKTITTNISEFKSSADKSIISLKSILERLLEKKLHPLLCTKPQNMEETIEKNTLFDFVNIQSVQNLQKQSIDELRELSVLEDTAKEVMILIDEEFVKISQQTSKIQISELDEFDLEPHKFNKSDIQNCINNILVIAGYFDKIQFLLSNPRELETVQFDFKDIASIKMQIEVSCNNIIKRCNQMENRGKELNQFFVTAQKCYLTVESISLIIPNKILQVDQLELMFGQRCIANQGLFDEISDLTHWYHLFYKSYDQLLVEIDRRNKGILKIENFVKSVNDQLLAMYADESRKRNAFNEEYGSYLPQSLCPSIQEMPTKFQVYPETIKTTLPKIEMTQEEIKKLDL